MLGPGSVRPDPSGGVKFTPEALRALFGRYEARMTTVFSHTPSGTRCSYRRALHLQAQAVSRCVRDGDARYTATGWRV